MDNSNSAFGQEFEAHVAAAVGPFIVLFGQDGADEANEGAAGEDADDVGAAADFFVESFLGVIGPDLAPDLATSRPRISRCPSR
jgi:hypothetical protein